MSDIPPTEIKLTASLPAGDSLHIRAILEECAQRAAQQSGVTIVNIFFNPGTVVIQDQSAKPSGSSTHIGGTETMNEKTEIHATGSVVNYKSTLNNVELLLNAAPTPKTSAENVVRQALKEFSDKLAAADAKHSDDAALLSQRLEELAKQATKPAADRKKNILEMSANSLKAAAIAVGDIVPGLITTAEKLTIAIAGWITST